MFSIWYKKNVRNWLPDLSFQYYSIFSIYQNAVYKLIEFLDPYISFKLNKGRNSFERPYIPLNGDNSYELVLTDL